MIKTITLIGSGNVATHLGKAFLNQGVEINQVYSYNKDNAFELANQLNAMPCDEIKFISDESDAYFICIKDDYIEDIAQQLSVKNKIVVHTSGSVPLQILNQFENHGIFYPLQTFSKEKDLDLTTVPFCIEANNKKTKHALLEFAKTLSNNVHEIDSEQRKKIHLAAVFACNFSNYMYSIAEDILRQEHLNFEMLKPLILETAKKTQENSPKAMQTGPAIRNDQEVIKEHIELLNDSKKHQEIYQLISHAILNSSDISK